MHTRADDQHCVEATVQASVESCSGIGIQERTIAEANGGVGGQGYARFGIVVDSNIRSRSG